MGLLRLAALGPPEIFHDDIRLSFALRKAQALLLYLAVEGGLHPRSKLAALLWPDSEPADARKTLRNAVLLLRHMLVDSHPNATTEGSTDEHQHHLLCLGDLVGLNQQMPMELDLSVVQQAYNAAQRFAIPPSEEQRARLVAQVQQALALVRGPFLDGFWLREETGFDVWHEQQQQQWQVRVQLLCERLSAWQEFGGELEQAHLTLLRWLALDPLAEEAARRLMRVYAARGDASAALRVYATLRTRLTEELRVEPAAETAALAEHIRAAQTRRTYTMARPTSAVEGRPPGELVVPLVGRAAAFGHLVNYYQLARTGLPQAVLLVGEASIGKTRLANEFVAWARAQGADVLAGQAFELGGCLPYQPLVEALRLRLEEENAPEDLLEDLWLAELSRLLPELRVRYPDLPAPIEGELTARGQMFEAVARLVEALAQRAPLVLLLDDLHWADGATLDLVRYLGHFWKAHSSRVLLLGTARQEGMELTSPLATQLAGLGRDLPLNQLALQPLNQAETRQLLMALLGQAAPGMKQENERGQLALKLPFSATSGAAPGPEQEAPQMTLADFLFARLGGQPLYLLETLKLLRDRQWLVPQPGAEGSWRLEPTEEMVAALAREESRRELVPASVRAMIQAQLVKLSAHARRLVHAGAVLGRPASAKLLWQVAQIEAQEGVEALEEAVASGILREEEAGAEQPGNYRFVHELMRDVVYTEAGAARRIVLHQQALAALEARGARACELAYHAQAAGEAKAACLYRVQAGDEALAVCAVEEAIEDYEQARSLLREHDALQGELDARWVEHLYVCLGRAYAFQNAWDQAQQIYEELLAYAQQLHLPALVSMTLNRLAVLAVQQAKDTSQVRVLLEQAWQHAQCSADQWTLAETEWNQAQIIGVLWEEPKRALAHGELALELARAIPDQELEARSLSLLGVIHNMEGDFEEAIPLLEAALKRYAALGQDLVVGRELSLPSFGIGAPLTQPLTCRASEAWCWGALAVAQVSTGQVQQSIASGRRALALSQEGKNVWTQVDSMLNLTQGLLEAGAYEEALVLKQHTLALEPPLLPPIIHLRLLLILGSTYQALQQWEEARAAFEEAEVMAERLDLRQFRVPALSRLCMHYAQAGEWAAASRYAWEALAARKRTNAALIAWDFYSHYKTEALLHEGGERQAREEVHRLGEQLGTYRRFRLPYLRSLAVVADWQGRSEQASGYLREAARLAADIGLPEEQWQIQAALARVYQAGGSTTQARQAWAKASQIIHGLAEGIKDEALRARYLAGPQVQQVVQQAQGLIKTESDEHAEQSRR
jgi:DNA-binding SARP family transcriptional activator